MIDVVIPCYNAATTLQRAVQSVLNQPELGLLWIVDDGSTDQTFSLAKSFEAQLPDKIRVEKMPQNGGALQVAKAIFEFQPETAVVRLALKPVGIAERYESHPNFDFAWQHMRMTCGGNVVFRRAFFLACGGFPQHALFRELGGEDGALGIATTKVARVATAFQDVGVLHYCREGMHAERLLDALLFGIQPKGVTPEKMTQAEAVTAQICYQINQLKIGLNSDEVGIQPVKLQWG